MENIKKIIFEKTPIDKIHTITRFIDFYEVHGSAGGEALTYRIYDNGSICER